jgi:hypothetical protein
LQQCRHLLLEGILLHVSMLGGTFLTQVMSIIIPGQLGVAEVQNSVKQCRLRVWIGVCVGCVCIKLLEVHSGDWQRWYAMSIALRSLSRLLNPQQLVFANQQHSQQVLLRSCICV